MSYEEANYEVVKKNEVYEIRKYSDRLAIETDISNEGNSFRKLFNYISGNNDKNEEIKMTTPVTQMQKKGKMTMQFYLRGRRRKAQAARHRPAGKTWRGRPQLGAGGARALPPQHGAGRKPARCRPAQRSGTAAPHRTGH